MRKSIVLLTFAAILSTFAAGCMPGAEGPVAEWAPRSVPVLTGMMPDRSISQLEDINLQNAAAQHKPVPTAAQ
jgi:hypothetical protein